MVYIVLPDIPHSLNILCLLDVLDGGNHSVGHALFGEIISGRIKVGILGQGLVLDLTVVDVEGVTLGTANQTLSDGSLVGQLHTKVLGEGSVGVGIKGNVGVHDLLVLGPSAHDSTVIDAVDHDFLNTDGR